MNRLQQAVADYRRAITEMQTLKLRSNIEHSIRETRLQQLEDRADAALHEAHAMLELADMQYADFLAAKKRCDDVRQRYTAERRELMTTHLEVGQIHDVLLEQREAVAREATELWEARRVAADSAQQLEACLVREKERLDKLRVKVEAKEKAVLRKEEKIAQEKVKIEEAQREAAKGGVWGYVIAVSERRSI
ncbi:hypothetical protein CGCS363_v001714 [Colletotrichum siamense]|uniref:uncharacterized protein n=1 Tax=Colletotrichum siamense TaxID=690259 RepID=UPI0018733E43|nr:uncharacterized protein CGCS363_v001714 [Colletotrichum siamense]KAF5516999.1 hypothetical protein CGCS363_v001714 [Colletotrichum siamense]